MNRSLDYYLVLSACNEAERIKGVILAAKNWAKKIIVVDDGSKDSTSEVAKKLGVSVLRHRLNLGKGAAMKTGAEAAFLLGAQAIVFIDADGQHDPRHLPEFLKKLTQGKQIVFGSRDFSSGIPTVRFLGNKLASILISLIFGIYRSDLLCGFMAMTKYAYQKVRWDAARYGVETEIVARTGKNRLEYGEVPIEAIYIDKYKGVTILDAMGILFNIPQWLVA